MAIKEQSKANDGEPLGRMRFEQETGIRESDWAGKYWTTWGEAVREAGFEPQSLNEGYGDDVLLAHLAALVRRLGRFPTSNEIRFARREDAGFPSHNTFARFGRKRDLVERLFDHCTNPGGEDAEVAAACREVLAGLPAVVAEEDAPGELQKGFVYLMRSGRHYKIGRTNSLGRREYELAIQLPERLELVHAIETDDTAGIERYWHARFADRRANGEWFALTKADVLAFRRRKKFM